LRWQAEFVVKVEGRLITGHVERVDGTPAVATNGNGHNEEEFVS